MPDQALAALRELTEAVMAEFFGNDTNLSKRLIKATNEAQLLLMVQPPDDDRVNHHAPAPDQVPDPTKMVAPPAEGEGDEEPCEICGGLGTIDETLGGYAYSNQAAECPGCGGSGCVSIDATPPAEGEVGGLVADLEVAAASYFNRGFVTDARRCRRAADLLKQQAAELAECREALRRVRRWGSTFGSHYSSAVAMGVMDWIDAGMTGPLPAMPEYLEGRPNG